MSRAIHDTHGPGGIFGGCPPSAGKNFFGDVETFLQIPIYNPIDLAQLPTLTQVRKIGGTNPQPWSPTCDCNSQKSIFKTTCITM